MKRWVVRAGDGADVRAILERLGEQVAAVPEGRVFVGRKRVQDARTEVRVGDVLTCAPASVATASSRVLAEAEGVVAVEKPAGIPTIADHGGSAHTLLAQTAALLGRPASSLHPTSRLDREVSGVVLFALTKAARDALADAREAGTYERRYIALAAAMPTPREGRWDAPIGRAADPRHRAVNGREATHATTDYAVTSELAGVALLALRPRTGRTHQLRVHSSHAGAPLLGDKVYGAPTRLVVANGGVLALTRIALHAAWVSVPLPSGRVLRVEAPVPEDLAAPWASLGGSPEAWNTASAWPLTAP